MNLGAQYDEIENQDNKIEINDETLSEILSKSYESSLTKDEQLKKIIELLTEKLNRDSDESIALAPLLREFLELSIKNDDQIIKIASVLQRTLSKNNSSKQLQQTNTLMIFNDEDKKKILDKISGKTDV